MSEPTRDEDALLTLAFSLQSNPGAYALLIGAGVSAPSGVLSAWDVLEDLVTKVASLTGGDVGDDPMAWFRSKYGVTPEYEPVLEKLAPTPLERQRLLKSYFEPTAGEAASGSKSPTDAHRSIARLVKSGSVKVIVTLNFDRLMEQAIREEHIEPTVVASPADFAGLAPLHTLDCCIIHLHGDYLNPTSMLNTKAELSSYDTSQAEVLHHILKDYGLIIAGWSATHDPALRDLISAVYPERLTLAWIEPYPPSVVATELRTSKKGLLFAVDADEGFGRIADAVDTLRTRNARHPLTVAVAVETAKRELSGRQTAIGLHDTLGREFTRLHALPEFHLADYQAPAEDGIDAMIGRVEEASKVTAALLATLAYWGDESTDEWWIGELERFAIYSHTSGTNSLLKLRYVTGAALFYATGVAAVAAKRFDLLARLLKLHHETSFNAKTELLADALGAGVAYEDASRVYSVVAPLLREALSMGTGPLDDAWQTFEVLRLAKLATRNSQFLVRFREAENAQAAVKEANLRLNMARGSGYEVDNRVREVGAAVEAVDRAFGVIGGFVSVPSLHLFADQQSYGVRFRNGTAERLADELVAAHGHPLLSGDIVGNWEWLAPALRGVSVAVGQEGYRLVHQRMVGLSGAIATETWLDAAS